MIDLPSSKEEKQASFKEHGRMERWMYVYELRSILSQFEDDDWVELNAVGNMVILRKDVEGFWVIDLGQTELEDYTKSEEDEND